ncbi:MAG: tRNA (adenosine(37)-N6)-threonylcarbamoyltransferase complex transferase subunit TsaD [Chloroflexi bacterium]|nr:tRNA (adenosine(37)-N6)-threonylcarbamoyltransferase complex transferase subunit TsaD [Chloroflexota bacterium]
MRLLGIETSCDETAAAVVADGAQILSNVVASQIPLHAVYGGVVPEVASRQHLLAILPVVKRALAEAGVSRADLAGVAVTVGPGLAGSLLVGVNLAKALAWAWSLPLLAINHLEAHLYAGWLTAEVPPDSASPPPLFPVLCLIVSGGHSLLLVMEEHRRYRFLGRSRDDAAGEAFDKVARLLGLGYPGGPAIQEAALKGEATAVPLPRPWLRGSPDFSFSGLKTAVLHLTLQEPPYRREDVAASFQEAVVDVLVAKTLGAAAQEGARSILLAGGVAANQLLRQRIIRDSPLPVHFPTSRLCTDNAAMVAAAGYYHLIQGDLAPWDADVMPNLPLP